MKNEERARQVLAHQLAMNEQSWQALQEHGVTEDSKLRLDFFYLAPGEREAENLRKKSWMVTGTTQPTTVSLAILNEWVGWMVAAGFERDCEFDGWGAQAG